jgi:hypothetical protein
MADGDAAELLESRGIFRTPVVSIDDELIVGFQRERIARALGVTDG